SSGGMNQRFVMAASTILSPPFLIADEPTKGLDRDCIADVVAELKSCIRDSGSSLMLITHDITVARTLADRISVMYAGEVVEEGPIGLVLSSPCHPYTRGLVGSLPENGFKPIPGMAPSPVAMPKGCRFHPRCRERLDCCSEIHPFMVDFNERMVRCWLCR
ncbi:oligopeptide/dipeptide ABC transporter ATP-binding protein, partial [Methanocalculus sp.]|uniref:oligopeptide/dipeptide ABC transporter ATP-binding protein n=1 Tax=Methanocalculus sp. TaxID=2004547 RepID=UPI002727AD31|nr:dipeptide ABC transporter ATP-binding protein DppD [Methanocalculus sp.]